MDNFSIKSEEMLSKQTKANKYEINIKKYKK